MNPRPHPYQGCALPLSYISIRSVRYAPFWHKNGAENGTQTRDPQLGRLVLYRLSYFRRCPLPRVYINVWVRMDSNHRSRETADLQSAPFGHSGTHPSRSRAKSQRLIATQSSGDLPLRSLQKRDVFAKPHFYSLEDDYGYFKDLTSFEPLVGLEPTTAGLQI